MDYNDLMTIGISFGLGLLVGLQRETVNNDMAGVRTFTLISLLGTLSGFLTEEFDNDFIIPVMAISIVLFMVVSNLLQIKKENPHAIGMTTEVAALLVFGIGAYLVFGEQVIAVILGGLLAVLLYAKKHLHGFINSLKDKDLAAIMTFVAISLIILPVLPDETFGPMNVLNLKNIWLMVVLIVGMGILGYFIYKWMGKNAGLISTGILGGIISSTATTVSFARKTKAGNSSGRLSAFVILLAVTVSLVRVMIEIFVVVKEQATQVILPIVVLFVLMLLLCVGLFYMISKESKVEELPEPKNPAQFKTAIIFALIYATILLIVEFTHREFGKEGLYVASALGGLANKDAITLSLSSMINNGMDADNGWRYIMTAIVSNLLFKGVIAATLGSKNLTKWIVIFMVISAGLAVLLMLFWPNDLTFLESGVG